MAQSKFDRMMNSLSNSDIALIRKAEQAGLTTFSQGVKSPYNDYDGTVAEWNAALNPKPVVVEDVVVEDVVVEETSELVTVVYASFEMDMTAGTTDADIRGAVEYAQQYEFDREDIGADEVRATIDMTVRGLIIARDEAFGQAV